MRHQYANLVVSFIKSLIEALPDLNTYTYKKAEHGLVTFSVSKLMDVVDLLTVQCMGDSGPVSQSVATLQCPRYTLVQWSQPRHL